MKAESAVLVKKPKTPIVLLAFLGSAGVAVFASFSARLQQPLLLVFCPLCMIPTLLFLVDYFTWSIAFDQNTITVKRLFKRKCYSYLEIRRAEEYYSVANLSRIIWVRFADGRQISFSDRCAFYLAAKDKLVRKSSLLYR